MSGFKNGKPLLNCNIVIRLQVGNSNTHHFFSNKLSVLISVFMLILYNFSKRISTIVFGRLCLQLYVRNMNLWNEYQS